MAWQPSASLSVLQQRAAMYQQLRAFFSERQVLEVEVPVLGDYATVDPFIDSLQSDVMGQTAFLQTSPEFFLKRLLAAYQHDIYSLGKAFRQGERGRRHRPEFTMLEWYRVGWTEQRLINEVGELLALFFPDKPISRYTYADLFSDVLLLNPHQATVDELSSCVRHVLGHTVDDGVINSDKNTLLDLLFTHCVEPHLPLGIVAISDYPASQAALARRGHNDNGQLVAKRFEVYVDRIELANGYWELNDGNEQQQRFQDDLAYRQAHQLPKLPYDEYLVSALKEGEMPDCAGVALGIDRLLMCWLDKSDIREVVSF
ncbi:EF-P lysine aminoacylase EpmA [Eionea flava]